jgi:hypothetical protein
MTASIKMTDCWDIAPNSLIETDCPGDALMMEAVSTSETSVNFYQTTWCNIPRTVIFLASYPTIRFLLKTPVHGVSYDI